MGGAKSAETERSETDVRAVERREGQEARRYADRWGRRGPLLDLPNLRIHLSGRATAAGVDAATDLLTTAGEAVVEASRVGKT